MKKLLFFLLVLTFYAPLLFSQTIYVNHAATGSNDGSSWQNAYQNLTTALTAAHANTAITQIWVAKGTYYPSTTNNRDDFFNIRRNNLQVYGGFAGTETDLTQRNAVVHPTILSGNIGSTTSNSDNSYHIMVIELNPSSPQPIDNSLVVDGFTFSEGNANAGSVFNSLYPRYTGSSIFISCNFNSINITPLIRNCIFADNRAFSSGALTYYGISAGSNALTIEKCTFQNNYAGYSGAAIDIMQLDAAGYGVPGVFSVAVEKCSFFGNAVDNYSQGGANGGVGAGINTFGQGTLRVNNTTFINNTIGPSTSFAGTYKGTAVSVRNGGNTTIVNSLAYANNNYIPFYNIQSTLTFVNATVYNPGSSALDLNNPVANNIYNSILWTDNSTANIIAVSNGSPTINIENSILNATRQGTITGSNIITTNPAFTNPASGDFSLQPGSPAINSGNGTFYNNSIYGNGDLEGNHRIAQTSIDIGAYESNSTALPVLFGAISAAIRNGQLLVAWTTESEIYNDHFDIDISDDGKQFTNIATVASKATGGSANTPLTYQYSTSISQLISILGAAAFAFLFLCPIGRQRHKTGPASVLLIAGVIFWSCSKQDQLSGNSNNLFLRIVQVDKDGKKSHSKILRVSEQ
ncbi:choice-of-anchor Q domain-containing protein [Niabella sp. CJ426]|uniref:choice-of-anchor Q domain-containing protein n=1 Tax=Niabella sp. CJ426 TaxID=3393740 RepID=UPI003D057A43